MRRRALHRFVATAAFSLLVVLLGAQAPAPPSSSSAAPPEPVRFARDVQPILERSCSTCHSADVALSDLDLSTRESALRGGAHGPAIVPGDAERSRLYRTIAGLEQPAMPMDGEALTPEQIATIKAWIDQGAQWETAVTFAKDIQPIMERSCWNCHGETLKLSQLDLRSREAALKGGAHGPSILPGNAELSRLYRVVAGLDAISMPMQGEKLTAAEIAAVKTWIEQGAEWTAAPASASTATPASNALAALETMDITPEQRNYWFYKLPVKAPVPDVDNPNLTNPIDRFLERDRKAKGLVAAPRADRRALIRRASLDLIGLPPTPAEVKAFLEDDSQYAWERVIERLLASPHYGERWGRHWLDMARYADSSGFEQDYDRPNAWRYRDYVINALNQDKPYTQFLVEQIAGDELDWTTHETLIATGFLRAGPRVLFREKDNPERRWDYVDDLIGTLGRGVLGLTVNCARCHNHKFDPIAQKDYYALAAALNGWVETEVPLAPPSEAAAYRQANKDIDTKVEALQKEIDQIEKPYSDQLRAEYIKRRFPENVQRAVFKPEAERTPGEQLLAQQVLTGGGGGSPEDISKLMSAAELSRRQQLEEQIKQLEAQRPEPLPMAEIVTDGDWRFAPYGSGDETIGCPKCRLPPPDRPNGTFLHEGPGRYEPPPTHFLIRGDPESKGSLMEPGFIGVATYGNPPTEIPRPSGRTSGRRLALARWIASDENPLTARVIVNRAWHHHFGRGFVASVDNFGKMGDLPTNQDLLDWMSVEFMERGWRLKDLHRLIMTSEAYQMASAFDHGGNLKVDPENTYVWRFTPQRLNAETIRDSMLAASGAINLKMGGEPIFPYMPPEVLATSKQAQRWKNTPDGPDTWRRSIYIYQRRSLQYPMMETFDHPDMNTSSPKRNISTQPTQALTLINNPFVISQAEILARRVEGEAPDDVARQIDLAYEYALARPPSALERTIALETVQKGTMVDFTHVLLNLNEFLYLE